MINLEVIRDIMGEVEVIDDEIASKNFYESLEVGKSSEDAVCERIQKKYPKAFRKKWYCKKF